MLSAGKLNRFTENSEPDLLTSNLLVILDILLQHLSLYRVTVLISGK